jgi:hypothetical protein
MSAEDLVVHLAKFAGALRERRISVSLSDEVDGAAALTLVDLRPRGVKTALRIALKIRRPGRGSVRLPSSTFSGGTAPAEAPVDPAARLAGPSRRRPQDLRLFAGSPERSRGRRGRDWKAKSPATAPRPSCAASRSDECSPADLAAMEKLLARLALRLATRRSRRLVPARGPGSSIRAAAFAERWPTDGSRFARESGRSRSPGWSFSAHERLDGRPYPFPARLPPVAREDRSENRDLRVQHRADAADTVAVGRARSGARSSGWPKASGLVGRNPHRESAWPSSPAPTETRWSTRRRRS